MDLFARDRMNKFQTFGMQIEPVRFASIEFVSQDRAMQSLGMGSVYAQLMRAACQRIKGDKGAGIRLF